MYKLTQYIKHLITATNQHGVHSPFVYDYVTKCLYAKPKFKASKSENVVLKSIPYFSAEKIKISLKDSEIEKRIEREFGLKESIQSPFDLIYIDTPKENILSIYKDKVHNDSMILINNIHKTKENTATWAALTQVEMVRVSIDMFHCGVLFFRKEQAKEHFKIWI